MQGALQILDKPCRGILSMGSSCAAVVPLKDLMPPGWMIVQVLFLPDCYGVLQLDGMGLYDNLQQQQGMNHAFYKMVTRLCCPEWSSVPIHTLICTDHLMILMLFQLLMRCPHFQKLFFFYKCLWILLFQLFCIMSPLTFICPSLDMLPTLGKRPSERLCPVRYHVVLFSSCELLKEVWLYVINLFIVFANNGIIFHIILHNLFTFKVGAA